MADRHLRELGRANEDAFVRLRSQVEELRLRSWRGAMRTAGPRTVTPESANLTQVLTLDAPRGRWEVHIGGNVEGVAYGYEVWSMRTECRDAATGEQIMGGGPLPSARVAVHTAASIDAPAVENMNSFGWIEPEVAFTFSLSVMAEAVGADEGAPLEIPTWNGLRMMLLPW